MRVDLKAENQDSCPCEDVLKQRGYFGFFLPASSQLASSEARSTLFFEAGGGDGSSSVEHRA